MLLERILLGIEQDSSWDGDGGGTVKEDAHVMQLKMKPNNIGGSKHGTILS